MPRPRREKEGKKSSAGGLQKSISAHPADKKKKRGEDRRNLVSVVILVQDVGWKGEG